MSSFRLARLLSLREDQAKAEKIRWALSVRAAQEAAQQLEACHERIRAASQELNDSHAQTGLRSGSTMGATVCAYNALDALNQRVAHYVEASAKAQALAEEARIPYDERRTQVEALRRLEERWTKEQRRTRRRRENLERESFINGQSRSTTNAAELA